MRTYLFVGCLVACTTGRLKSDGTNENQAGQDGQNGGSGPIVEPGSPGAADVTFTVRFDQDTHPISPLIYGSNAADELSRSNTALVRMGGNRWTAYNWENNASNAGSDFCFQNDGHLSSSNVPGEAVREAIVDATERGAAVLLTIPNVDYVAADKNGNCDVRDSGSNYLQTRFRQNKPSKSTPFTSTPDTSDAFVYQDEFANWVKGTFPSATIFFSMDNEPDLWRDTHPEVHPQALSYEELVVRNADYAQAVKKVFPEAKITGFVSYGFGGYTNLQNAPDAAGKGEFIDYYLKRMRETEQTAGTRLIDYLDLHWYPEARGGGTRIVEASTASGTVTARIQAPRSLWDDSYTEDSWVAEYLNGPVRLIPREKEKIAANYPGTKLAFTEWNFGGGGHISGAIATADVLGIFGRDQVGMATLWDLNHDESFTYAAMRAYRSFDGAGGHFGDTSMHADTSNVETSSVYASYDAANPSHVVIIAINKRDSAAKAGITIAHPTQFSKANVYTITAGGGAEVVSSPSLSAVSANAFNYEMPGYSVSVIVPEI